LEAIFLLNNLRSAFNVGSILRTGEFLGFKNFVLAGYTPGLADKKVLKTSLGAEKNLNIKITKKPLLLIKNFKRQGFYIISLEQNKNSIPFYKFKPKNKMLIILGNEVLGVPKKILNISDYILEIPKKGEVKESLNVAISFSILVSYLSFKDKFSKTV